MTVPARNTRKQSSQFMPRYHQSRIRYNSLAGAQTFVVPPLVSGIAICSARVDDSIRSTKTTPHHVPRFNTRQSSGRVRAFGISFTMIRLSSVSQTVMSSHRRS